MKAKLHPGTFDKIEAYLRRPSHSLIISGLGQPARQAIVDHITPRLTTMDNIIKVEVEGSSISINSVKQLYPALHRRRNDNQTSVVILPQAHKLTLPAQNALLKLLEEPPAHALFLLAVDRADALLPTVRSRSQLLELFPLPVEQFKQVLGIKDDSLAQLYAISSGDPFMAQQLKSDEAAWTIVRMSRQLLQEPLGQALLQLNQLVKDGKQIDILVLTLGRIARLGLEKAAGPADKRAWLRRAEAATSAFDQLSGQLNQKMVLDRLLLEFRAA